VILYLISNIIRDGNMDLVRRTSSQTCEKNADGSG